MTQLVHNRKDQIYHVAARLFSQHGYHATTMREIAREVQIEGGSLYSHISGKQDVLYEIVLRASRQFLEAAREVRAARIPAHEQLRAFMRRHLAIIADSTDRAAVYFHEWHHLDLEQQAIIIKHRDEYESYLRAILRDGMASGVFSAGDERLRSLQVLSLLNWTYQWYQPAGTWSADYLAEQYYHLIMSGIALPGTSPP